MLQMLEIEYSNIHILKVSKTRSMAVAQRYNMGLIILMSRV
jgi:hypothetical protein